MKSPTILLFPIAISLAVLLPSGALDAETLLISVTETADGQPCAPPPPSTEGIFDGLFEEGHIVFNTEDGAAPVPQEKLLDIAASGGARYMLEAAVVYTRSPLADGLTSVSATARFALLGVRGGETVGSETLSDNNRGREKDMDMAKLGFELGARIAGEAGKWLRETPAGAEK